MYYSKLGQNFNLTLVFPVMFLFIRFSCACVCEFFFNFSFLLHSENRFRLIICPIFWRYNYVWQNDGVLLVVGTGVSVILPFKLYCLSISANLPIKSLLVWYYGVCFNASYRVLAKPNTKLRRSMHISRNLAIYCSCSSLWRLTQQPSLDKLW